MGISFSIKFPIEAFRMIVPGSNIMLIGSCFSENIGSKLSTAGFHTHINPFGNLYNPVSIARSVEHIAQNSPYQESDLFQNHEKRFVSFDHHGIFSGTDAGNVITQINNSIEKAHQDLKKTDCIIITLGSAWVYKYLKENRVVANCHKVPGTEFEKSLLALFEVVDELQKIADILNTACKGINIIWTISPVKHLRDGVIENQQSKATLILALKTILKEGNENMFYFPAYEIVTDELRDYRFFEADHAHPNSLAIDYTWDRFMQTCFTSQALDMVIQSEALNKVLGHKTLHKNIHPESLHHKIQSFLEKFPLKK